MYETGKISSVRFGRRPRTEDHQRETELLKLTYRKTTDHFRGALLLGAALCVVAFVAVRLSGDSLSVDGFRAAILDFGVAGPMASVALMVLHGLLPIPVEFLSAANGVIFGFWGGVALTWLGMMLAAWTGYGVARLASGPVLGFVPHRAVEKSREWMGRGGWWKLLLARQMPFVSFWAMNLALGLLRVSFLRFTWTTAVGNVPYAVAIVLISTSVT